MSVKISGMIWDTNLPRDKKFIALAYADHADHEGQNVFPSKDLICRKTGYSRRSVEAITKQLLNDEIMITDGVSERKTIKYRFNLQKITPADSAGTQNTAVTPAKKVVPIRDKPSIEPSEDLFNKNGADHGPIFQNETLELLWYRWKQERKESKVKFTPSIEGAQIAKLKAMGEERAIAALRHSLGHGWQGIFEPKDNGRAPAAKKPRTDFEALRGDPSKAL